MNVTLIFSLEQYEKTAAAYLEGVAGLLKNKGDARSIRSVASVFVSRIDTAVDKLLDQLQGQDEAASLKGKAAVANSNLIYRAYSEIFSGNPFKGMEKQGASVQRVLWGSTGTKNPAYSDIKYMAELIGRDTVNTSPENTLEAFLEQQDGDVRIYDTSKFTGWLKGLLGGVRELPTVVVDGEKHSGFKEAKRALAAWR